MAVKVMAKVSELKMTIKMNAKHQIELMRGMFV